MTLWPMMLQYTLLGMVTLKIYLLHLQVREIHNFYCIKSPINMGLSQMLEITLLMLLLLILTEVQRETYSVSMMSKKCGGSTSKQVTWCMRLWREFRLPSQPHKTQTLASVMLSTMEQTTDSSGSSGTLR